MAEKMYKKDELTYKNGYIVNKKGKVIAVGNLIVSLFNKLEEDYQRAMWDKAHAVKPVPEVEEFAFQTERGKIYPHVTADTERLDKAVEVTMGIMEDIDAIEQANRVNEYLDNIQPLIEWVSDECVVSYALNIGQPRFDLKNVGNPLELDPDTLVEMVVRMFE